MKRLKNYVSEQTLLERKDSDRMRVCREDCAVLDPGDGFRILACRGKHLVTGEPYAPIAQLSPSQHARLFSHLAGHGRLLLSGEGRTVLLFGDFFETGVVLAVESEGSLASTWRVLERIGHSEFLTLEAGLDTSAARKEDEGVYLRMAELFYYVDRMFLPSERLHFQTRVRLIANFAGCTPNENDPPKPDVLLSPHAENRFLAFLLCLFLTLRAEASTLSIGIEPTEPLPISWHAAWETSPESGLSSPDGAAAQLLQKFHGVTLRKTEAGWVLTMDLPRLTEDRSLCAPDGRPTYLCLVFSLDLPK